MTTANLSISDTDPVIQHTSTGETAFTFPFPILDTDELKVSIDQVDQTYGTDFTISGVGEDSGGTVTFTSATTSGELITIWRDTPIERLTGFSGGAATILPAALNDEFAAIFRMLLERERDQGRALQLAIDDPQAGQDMVIPTQTTRAGKVLGFTAGGVPTVLDVTSSEDTSLRADLAANDAAKGSSLVAIAKDQAEIDAAVTIVDATQPRRSIARYVDVGAADHTPGFTAVEAVCAQEPGQVIIPPGTWLVKSWDWSVSDCEFLCYGIIKHASDSTGYVMKIGNGATAVARLKGSLVFDSGTSGAALTGTVAALRITGLIESNLLVTADGFDYGIDVPTEAAVAYNKFFLANMLNCERAIYIHPGAAGFCNKNEFHGGRFALTSGITFNSQWSIYIEHSGTNRPNDNQFFAPSFEGKGGILYDEGSMNHVHDARVEVTTTGTAGSDFADPYISRQGPGHCWFTTSYTGQLKQITKDLGAGTRVSDNQFTLAGTDYTAYLYEGARLYVTVGGTEYECTVHSSTFSTNTTVRVIEPFITGNPTAVKPVLIKVASSANPGFSFANDDVAGVADAASVSYNRLLLALMSCAVTIRGFGDDRPALTLVPRGSSGNTVLQTRDVSGVKGLDINGSGYTYAPRFSIGDVTTPIQSRSHVTDASESHGVSGSGDDATINAALDALGGKVNAILATLEAFGNHASS